MNNQQLEQKALSATGNLLREHGYISFVDLFVALGYLDRKDVENWRMRRVPYLEKVVRLNLSKITTVMKAVRKNSLKGNLKASQTVYMSWGKGRKQRLRFSKSGKEDVERAWSTHYVKPKNPSQPPLPSPSPSPERDLGENP